MRKTFRVARALALANHTLRHGRTHPKHREGVCAFIEGVLHEADAYSGYGHLNEPLVPEGEAPGIRGEPGNFEFPDETRRVYFVPVAIREEYLVEWDKLAANCGECERNREAA